MDPIQFSQITTRGGDEGKTSLANGERRFKSEKIFDVLGTIDELSSSLGLFKAHLAECTDLQVNSMGLVEQIYTIQKNLVLVGGQVATPAPLVCKKPLDSKALEQLESWEQAFIVDLVLKGFIVPGGSVLLASGDLARAVCRRTERQLVQYMQESHALGLEPCQRYLNRLADYLFVVCRQIAQRTGVTEI